MLQEVVTEEGQRMKSRAGLVVRWDWSSWESCPIHARRDLEGEAVAPGSEKTWKAVTDGAKRPRTAREGIDQELDVNPTVPVDLDVDLLLKNLRTSRRGAAAGPSRMTTEHLKILDTTECCTLFGEAATLFARGQIPQEILQASELGE